MKDNNKEKVDLSLDNEEFFKRYGRKKIIATFTLGCPQVKANMIPLTPCVERFGWHGKKSRFLI